MNNKGFAISTMLYGLIIIIALVMMSIISIMAFNRSNSKKFTEKVRTKLEQQKIKTFKPGDYIEMTPTITSYNVSKTDTGHTADQTIIPSELTKWIVISTDNGVIEAVSESVSSAIVIFGGTAGYAKYVGTLQKIAEQYSSTLTASVRMMGYGGQNAEITNADELALFNGTYIVPPATTSTDFITEPADDNNGTESLNGVLGDTLYLRDYRLVKNISALKANKVGTTTPTVYWIASRRYYYQNDTYFGFLGLEIDNNGSLNNTFLRYYSSGWGDYAQGWALRPIITLKSGVIPNPDDDRDGTAAKPYTLRYS